MGQNKVLGGISDAQPGTKKVVATNEGKESKKCLKLLWRAKLPHFNYDSKTCDTTFINLPPYLNKETWLQYPTTF